MRSHSLLMSKVAFLLCFVSTISISSLGYSQEGKIETYPSKAVTFIVPFPPGSGPDSLFRVFGKEVEKYLGQPFVITNRPGGNGSLGVSVVASANPDGYTIGQCPGGGSLFTIPFLEKVPYHPLKDFEYIIGIASINFGVAVKADSPFKSFRDIITYARQDHKKLFYGTSGQNSIAYFLMDEIAKRENVELIHMPYKGSPEFTAALLGGHIQFLAGEFSVPLVEAGKIRVLAFFSEHVSEYPQVPTLKDIGYDIPIAYAYYDGVLAPKSTRELVVKKIHDVFKKAMEQPACRKVLKDFFRTIRYSNSHDYGDWVTHTYGTFEKMFKERGITK
jgi:tripartite-type tricarboxylate transporter receptor subunit TctC